MKSKNLLKLSLFLYLFLGFLQNARSQTTWRLYNTTTSDFTGAGNLGIILCDNQGANCFNPAPGANYNGPPAWTGVGIFPYTEIDISAYPNFTVYRFDLLNPHCNGSVGGDDWIRICGNPPAPCPPPSDTINGEDQSSPPNCVPYDIEFDHGAGPGRPEDGWIH